MAAVDAGHKAPKPALAEVVIAMTHCRLPVDRQLTEQCPSIDYLLGGHVGLVEENPTIQGSETP